MSCWAGVEAANNLPGIPRRLGCCAMTRATYLTARCTRGCERWGTPDAMERHVVERHCSGVAWFRRPVTTALIPPKHIRVIEGTAAAALLAPTVAGDHDRDGRPRSYRPYAVHSGGRLRSPIEGVPPRVWWLAVKHRIDEVVPADAVVNRAMNAESFTTMVPDGFLDQFVACLRRHRRAPGIPPANEHPVRDRRGGAPSHGPLDGGLPGPVDRG